MIFDMEKKKLYKDLVDWVECNCPVEDCYCCPINPLTIIIMARNAIVQNLWNCILTAPLNCCGIG